MIYTQYVSMHNITYTYTYIYTYLPIYVPLDPVRGEDLPLRPRPHPPTAPGRHRGRLHCER